MITLEEDTSPYCSKRACKDSEGVFGESFATKIFIKVKKMLKMNKMKSLHNQMKTGSNLQLNMTLQTF